MRRLILSVVLALTVSLAGCTQVADLPGLPPPPSTSQSAPATTPPVVTTPPVTTPPVTTPPVTTPPVTTPPVTTPPVTTPVPPPVQSRTYPMHTNIVSTTFWVGEIFDASLPDGSQVCSTYDSQWALHWGGVSANHNAGKGTDCEGSTIGGCDGIPSVDANEKPTGASCKTEPRKSGNGFYPTSPYVHPKENPFYLDLPFDDVNNSTAFKTRCQVIPWANDAGFAGKCSDKNFSYMKNRWVRIIGPNGHTCYGQIEDAGPSHDDLYHDSAYVFGSNDARPVQKEFNQAGMDVSPALNGCLGFSDLDGDNDKVKWQFVDAVDIPKGDPALKIVTTTPFTP